MRIALIASECVPFVKTGGLADVTGALGGALSALGHEVKVFVPLYRRIDRNSHGLKASLDLGRLQADCPTPFSFSAWYSRLPGSDAMVH
ncbi:MAG: glycogen synthase, partial [Bacteroidetes bacterium]|nr:glycogen synthase [Bacteroidota bacterium]